MMSENRFMWCSVDGGENVFIKDKESESDKTIDIKITDGKYEFVELMKTINELNDENEQLKEELNNLKKDETMLYHYYTLARYGGD